MLAATALVLLMTPGLAFFYGGMSRAKSVLNMMMMSWVAIITVTIAWVLYGDSLSFAKGNGFIGGLEYLGEHGLVNSATRVNGIPDLIFSAFQLTFAVITVALISGAIADRTKFGAWAVFTVAWATLVYFPVAHWVWGGGWLSSLGIEDFAGGTVVHVNAGSPGSRSRSSSASDGAGPRTRCGRITSRWCCSARACCGSAGSASTRAPSWRRTEPPPWRS
jgi:Amt family ammonium transporter